MSRKKHIVMTVNAAWNLLNYRLGIIRMLREQGHLVTLLAPEDKTADRLRALGCAFEPINISRRGKSPLAEARVAWRIYRLLKRLRPDAVISFTIKNNIYCGIACRFLNIPFLPNVSGRGAVFSESYSTVAVVLIAYRLAFGRAAKVFYQNAEDRDIFLGHGIGYAERTVLLPGSGVNLEQFKKTPLPNTPEAPVFVMIARVLHDKGVREYAEAARELQTRYQKAMCILVGEHEDGPGYVPTVDLKCWRANRVIDYRGSVDDVRPVLAAADAVVLPSYYLEGTPRVLIEAGAMGRPIVTTDTPGCRDVVIEGKNGFLVQPRDSGDLAEKLLCIADMTPSARSAMGNISRQHIEDNFDEQYVIDAYRTAIIEALQ